MIVRHWYFLKYGDAPEREVNMADWVRAERAGGFNPTGATDAGQPATGGFITAEGIHGRIKTTIEE